MSEGLHPEPDEVGGTEQFDRGEHGDGTFDDRTDAHSDEEHLRVRPGGVAEHRHQRGVTPVRHGTAHHEIPRRFGRFNGFNTNVPPTSSLVGFAAVAFAIIIIPGPSVMFVVSRAVSLRASRRVGDRARNAAGAYTQVLLVAVGIGAIVERSIAVFTAIKLLGAAYLVWLGIQTFRHRRDASAVDPSPVIARSTRSLLIDGFAVGSSNPKTIVFFAAILPQFVDHGGAPGALQMAVLGLVFVAVALVSDSAWGLGAGTARQWFVRSPRRLEVLSGFGGVVIVGLGLRLAMIDRKH